MRDPDHPGPKRKGRAAAVVAAIVLLLVAVIFLGFNSSYLREDEDDTERVQTK